MKEARKTMIFGFKIWDEKTFGLIRTCDYIFFTSTTLDSNNEASPSNMDSSFDNSDKVFSTRTVQMSTTIASDYLSTLKLLIPASDNCYKINDANFTNGKKNMAPELHCC